MPLVPDLYFTAIWTFQTCISYKGWHTNDDTFLNIHHIVLKSRSVVGGEANEMFNKCNFILLSGFFTKEQRISSSC